jgi:hypothetical protein
MSVASSSAAVPDSPCVDLRDFMFKVPPGTFARNEFMRRNDHLISPWKYTPQQIEERNFVMAQWNWQRNNPRHE